MKISLMLSICAGWIAILPMARAVYGRDQRGVVRPKSIGQILTLGVPTKKRLSSRKRGHAEILRASKIMEDARAKTAVSSTQENAFMALAAEALADKSLTIALSVNGVPQRGAFFKNWRAAALANKTAPHDTKWTENPHSAPHVGVTPNPIAALGSRR